MSKAAIVVIFALHCCVSTHCSTDDWYADYPEDGPWIPADMINVNGNVSLADVEKIVQEKVATAKKEMKEKLIAEILGDDRLKSVINIVRKKEMDKIRDCRSQNYSYWDDGIPECRSCLMPRCLEHEPCERECRDILKILQLEKDAADARKEMDNIRECRSKNDTYWDDEIHKCQNCFLSDCHERKPCRRECRDILKIRKLEIKAAAAKEERKEQKADISSGQETDEFTRKLLNGLIVVIAVLFVVLAVCVIVIGIRVKDRNVVSAVQVNEAGQDPKQETKRETVWQQITRRLVCRRRVNTGSDDVALDSRTEGPIPESGRAFQEEALINGNASPA